MRCSYGVTAYFLEQSYLAAECSLVESRTQGTEVVMKADTLEFAQHAVEFEAVAGVLNLPDSGFAFLPVKASTLSKDFSEEFDRLSSTTTSYPAFCNSPQV